MQEVGFFPQFNFIVMFTHVAPKFYTCAMFKSLIFAQCLIDIISWYSFILRWCVEAQQPSQPLESLTE